MHKINLILMVIGLLFSQLIAATTPVTAFSTTESTENVNVISTSVVKQKVSKKGGLAKKIVLKALKREGGSGMSKGLAIVLMIVLAPFAFLWVGLVTDWDKAWWITLLLSLVFLLPGWIYGLIKILKS